MKIIIVGGGWYGCHLALLLKDKHDVTIIEKNSDIFDNSSYYNQNRAHLGFHYCRDYDTRVLCQNNYYKFMEKYGQLVDDIKDNYYLISNSSFVDYNTYVAIYSHEKFKFDLVENCTFKNVQGKLISTEEKCINSDKVYYFFKENMENVNCIFDTVVEQYQTIHPNKLVVKCTKNSNETKFYECDMLFDCTYGQLEWSEQKLNYELTCSLLLKKKQSTSFGAITVMDGKFFSIYPRDIENGIYTLTDVEYTPIVSSSSFGDIEKFRVDSMLIENVKNKMFDKVKMYYSSLEEDFEYIGYFLSKKTKQISGSDSRNITITQVENNVISVNCGKIYGIFELEKYVSDVLKL